MLSEKHKKINLVQRNEGKVKSYESCVDVRAWSHDTAARNRYLRDWIKSDMPVCVVPINTVSSALRMMSWRRRGKIAPKCHPECKSKLILDTIYSSCNAMKSCFKEKDEYTKYFEEEEFETSHWPCDRCLDALKNIRLFWKIILDKLFKVKFPYDSDTIDGKKYSNTSIKNIAKAWQKDLIEEAIFVKNISPFINDRFNSTKSNSSVINELENQSSHSIFHKKLFKHVSTDTDFIIFNTHIKRCNSTKSLCKKLSRCTSVKIRTCDAGCGMSDIVEDNEEVNLYKNNLDYLQQQFNLQNEELEQLKKENMSLKLELRHSRSNSFPSYAPVLLSDSNAIEAPPPFESCYEETSDIKDIESEMLITLKNCKNKNFRHVSMLQVLHKTNCLSNETFNNNYCKKSDDPIEVLTKVHDTFGAIVKRELTIANKKKTNVKNKNNLYQRANKEKFNRICSENSSHCTISDTIFMSTTEV